MVPEVVVLVVDVLLLPVKFVSVLIVVLVKAVVLVVVVDEVLEDLIGRIGG